jgi:hypothetical protein
MSVDREINQNVVETFGKGRLLNWQIAAQAVAIRMSFTRRVVCMPVCRCIVIVITARICPEPGKGSISSNRVVLIMPATSKHCMDEQ